MRWRPWANLALVPLLALCAAAWAAPRPVGRHLTLPPAAWRLAWADEFAGNTLDTSKWSIGLPWMGDDGTNRHHNRQYASTIMDDDMVVRGGRLHLTTRRRDVQRPSGARYGFTEGLVTTNGKFAVAYGYIEMRARMPVEAGAGTWPAFWLLAGGWPPEMDVIEYWGSHNRVHQGLATSAPNGGQRWDSWHASDVSLRGWHTYGLEWGPGYQRYSIDGVVNLSVHGSHVPSEPHYLLLNSGVETARPPSAATRFPNDFEVDYVRVYARPDVPALLNGGFDEPSLAPWGRWNAAAIVDAGARTGRRALRVDPGGSPGGAASAQQTVYGLSPGARYRMAAWARCAAGAAARLGVKEHGAVEERSGDARGSRWTLVQLTFTTGQDVTSATVYCWAEGEGVVWFDDVRLERIGEVGAAGAR